MRRGFSHFMGRRMEQTETKPAGWHSFRFIYTASGVAKFSDTPQEERCDSACKQERIDCGCYRAVVDFDALDQN